MSTTDYLIIWIGSIFTLIFQILCYKEYTSKKIKITYFSVFLILINAVLTVINIYFNYSYTKLIISFSLITINCFLIFKENFNVLIIKMLYIYLIIGLSEVMLSVSILASNINNIIDFDTSVLIKVVFSIIVMVTSLLICKIKSLKGVANKLIEKISAKISYTFYLIVSLLLTIFLAYKFINTFQVEVYIFNLLILICFVSLMVNSILNHIKTKKATRQYEALLSFMSKYEKIIDESRINRHEMLNNLLILKSFKNKNSVGFSNTLNDLIELYEKNNETIKNVYKLPSGLKGILYYKIYDMKTLNIETNLNISKGVQALFKKINDKEYSCLCRVIAILLDNAKDAASIASKRIVLIEMYFDDKGFVFRIDNTFKDRLDMSKLATMNYSTRGEGRGLGLFIANSIINKSDNMTLDQKIIDGKYFSSTIRLNK